MQSLQSSHPTVNPRNFQDSLKLHPNNIAPCHEDRWSPRHTSWRWEPPGRTFQDIGGLVKLFIQRERCQYPCVLICVNFISNIHYIYLYTWNLFLSFVLGVEPPKKQVLFGFQVHTLYIISFVIVNTCNWGIYAVRSNRYINQFVLQVYTTCLHNLFAWFHPLNSCRRWPCLSGPPCLEFQWWRSIPERRSCVSLRKWRDTVPPPRNIMGNLLE